MKCIPKAYKPFDAFVRHKAVFSIKYISIGVIDVDGPVKWIERPHDGVCLHKIEKVLDTRVDLNTHFEFLGYLYILHGIGL